HTDFHESKLLPSIDCGIGTPKYFRIVGARSIMLGKSKSTPCRKERDKGGATARWFMNKIPGTASGSIMWSPLHLRMLSSINELANPPTALCHDTRNPGAKLTSRSGAFAAYGPQ